MNGQLIVQVLHVEERSVVWRELSRTPHHLCPTTVVKFSIAVLNATNAKRCIVDVSSLMFNCAELYGFWISGYKMGNLETLHQSASGSAEHALLA
jgi:hypothetical protein